MKLLHETADIPPSDARKQLSSWSQAPQQVTGDAGLKEPVPSQEISYLLVTEMRNI